MERKEKFAANKHQRRHGRLWGEGTNRLRVNMNRGLALVLVILFIPVYMVIAVLVMVLTGRPIFFIQERIGYLGKKFKMYKFRTMVVGAEERQKKLWPRNEASGPVFKIWNDPRFTKLGKTLSHSGLDELPQLWNVIKGEMSIVGPRPLPVTEEEQIDVKYKKIRESVRPGIISPWILDGYHRLNFKEWMEKDKKYIENKSILRDSVFVIRGGFLLLKLMLKEFVVLIK